VSCVFLPSLLIGYVCFGKRVEELLDGQMTSFCSTEEIQLFSENCFEFGLMGIVYINHLSHYGAADKEGQIVGMRGPARGSHAVDNNGKDVC
jgi:hypothetical protein